MYFFKPTAITLVTGLLVACGGDSSDDPPAVRNLAEQNCNVAALQAALPASDKLLSSTLVKAGSLPLGPNNSLQDLPAFCQILGQTSPSSHSLINFEIWTPLGDAWNGKLVVTGNGGYSPALSYGDMAYALRQGYAVVGGDTGHQSSNPNAMDWGVGQPEKILDWGKRSIHAITQPSKQLIERLTSTAASRSYYYGCSTGGHQAFAQMQHYPADFDGVIAGAPGHNRTRLNVDFLHRFLANREQGSNGPVILTPAKARFVTQQVVAACDGLDGVVDGVMEDPRMCTPAHFDIRSLQCQAEENDTCLTTAQIEVVEKIYQGPVNPVTGEQLYPGHLPGSEAGWPGYWGSDSPVRADYWRLWAFDDPQWDWWTFDYNRDVTRAEMVLGPLVDQTSADLRAFAAAGAKAIVYHGWQDAVVNPVDSIRYYEQVQALHGAQTGDFMRLFMVPGMGHCSGGSGAVVFGNGGQQAANAHAGNDLLHALDAWVEQGKAPEQIVASAAHNAAPRSKPLCAYPAKAVYDGRGNSSDAASYSCQ